jgi:hypothetical protein
LQNNDLLFDFFGLGSELETDRISQPPASPYTPNLARKDKEWTKVGTSGSLKLALALSHIVPNGC